MMDHSMIEARLDAFVDGLLDADDRAAVERHLPECEGCRAEVDATRHLRDAARGLPREIAPGRDLWPGIAARIRADATPMPARDDKVRVLRIDPVRRPRPAWWMRRELLAAAAIALVVLSSSVTALLVRGGPAGVLGVPGGVAVGEPGPASRPPPGSALVAMQPAEQEVVTTVEQLQFALEAQRDRLDPATIAVVEENLRVIDRAIAEARAALEADPNNHDLTFLLMEVYHKKVDLLQNTVQIASL